MSSQLASDWQSKSTPPESKVVSRAISSENVLLKPGFEPATIAELETRSSVT
jgi:hypothetical protein